MPRSLVTVSAIGPGVRSLFAHFRRRGRVVSIFSELFSGLPRPFYPWRCFVFYLPVVALLQPVFALFGSWLANQFFLGWNLFFEGFIVDLFMLVLGNSAPPRLIRTGQLFFVLVFIFFFILELS